jgi:hypothetical protein
MHDAVGFAHLLLQQFQLLPRPMIRGRQHQIQIVGARIDYAQRLAEVVNEDAHNRPNVLWKRVGGSFGREC